MSYSKGIFWLDDCRIPHNEPIKIMKPQDGGNKIYQQAGRREETTELKEQGRFSPNLLVCDNMLNDGSVSKKSKPKITQVGIGRGVIGNHDGRKTIIKAKEGMEMLRSVGDSGTNSRFYDLDLWFDKMLERL